MNQEFNIFVTATSRRVAMIRGFKKALGNLGVPGKVIASDTDKMSTGLRFCDKFHIVPLSSSSDYIPQLLEICEKEKIKLLAPTIDEELEIFGQRKKEFEAIGVTVLVSDKEVGKVCRDKYLTYKFFKKHGFPFAETLLPSQIDYGAVKYPLFIKPRLGRGSVGARPIKNEKELRFFTDYVDDPIIQRFLAGDEYTVDVLAGMDGKILSVVPRERLVIRAGVCDRGRTRKIPKLIDLSKSICEKLGVLGPVNLQCMAQGEEINFFEINPRFSGAIQLTVASGADFFTMIVKEALGQAVAPAIGEFKDNFMMLSYEESIFESMNGAKS